MNNDVPFHSGYTQLNYLNEDANNIYDQLPQQHTSDQQQGTLDDNTADTDIPLDESIPHPLHILQQQQQQQQQQHQHQEQVQGDDEELDEDDEIEDDRLEELPLEQQGDDDEFGAGGAFANVGQGLSGRYKNMMMQYWQETINSIEHDEHDFKNHQLPLARIKKVMKTDEEVRMISAEAPILFAKGCDIFITELTMRAWIHAEENKRRTLQRSDIAALLQKSDMFDFLIDIVPREEEKPKRTHTTGSSGTTTGATTNMTTTTTTNINNRNLDDGLTNHDDSISSSVVNNLSNGLNHHTSNDGFTQP